jgi:hypothetical protein
VQIRRYTGGNISDASGKRINVVHLHRQFYSHGGSPVDEIRDCVIALAG